MILQDLIRNIVLYNGVIDPYLHSMKERLLLLLSYSYGQNSLQLAVFRAYLQENTEASLPHFVTGTHTLSQLEKALSVTFSTIYREDRGKHDRGSSIVIIMPVDKSIVTSSKTNSQTSSSCIVSLRNQTGTYVKSTTGSFIENPNLFFSHETHEKREYLGEFSLPHEEIQLNTFRGRG